MQTPIGSDCDVIIVNYNAGKPLLDSVASAFSAGADRVIVVDNHSTDGSLEPLEQLQADEKPLIIRNDKNLGFAAACNIGIRASSAKRLLFLNPDSVLARDALIKMNEVLDASDRVGMVGGFLCNPDGTEQPGGRRTFPTPGRAMARAFGLSGLAKLFPGVFSDFLLHEEPIPDHPVEVEAISGACMLVRREVLDDVGLWDEGYFLHCEDLDWCMRLSRKDWKVMFVPDAKVTHLWKVCSRSRPIFVEWHKHKGMMRFYRKFFRRQNSGIMMWLVAAGVWLRFVLVAGYHAGRAALARIRRQDG